jgi:hypothetical protein
VGNTYRLGNGPFKFTGAENDLGDESLQILNQWRLRFGLREMNGFKCDEVAYAKEHVANCIRLGSATGVADALW